MPSIANIIRSNYESDKTPCGNGVGWLAMQGRFISAVDLTIQGIEYAVGTAMTPVYALFLVTTVGVVKFISEVLLKALSGDFDEAWDGLKNCPGRFTRYTTFLVLTMTVGIIANTLLRIITIAGDALGILFPLVGQHTRKMEIGITGYLGDLSTEPFIDTCKDYFKYSFPRPVAMIITHGELVEKK